MWLTSKCLKAITSSRGTPLFVSMIPTAYYNELEMGRVVIGRLDVIASF